MDINPGDRASDCGGMMEPVAVEGASPEYALVHRCVKCGYEKPNALAEEDDMDAVLAIVSHVR